MHARHAERDDLSLEAYLHAVKRQPVGMGLFVLQRRQARVAAQKRQYRVHALGASGDGAVDAFGRQQQRAFDAVRFTARQQRRLQLGKVGKFDEFIQCSGQEIRHGDKRAG